ncbi:MAG TPA: enoyl-CoA hydratase [Rhizobiales bacterium]|nr:enoyl-CoA hydratase [Hyphomicrobiales bacterium]
MVHNSPPRHIKTWLENSTGHIQFNRPESRNAISAQMWRDIPQLIENFDKNDQVRTIVLSGAGNECFSAGADISEFSTNRTQSNAARQYEALNVAAFTAIANTSKPTIASIAGYCMGGGLAIALSCDLRIAAENAIFCLPPAKLGLAYPLEGIRQLLGVISPPVAKEMIFTGRTFNALDASRSGLVNEVTTLDQLQDTVEALCKTIAQNAPLTIAASKQTIDELHHHPENPDMEKLTALSDQCFASSDYLEGQKAFAEKRKPVFQGK